MNTFLVTFLLHWSHYQFHNTLWHLALGLGLGIALLAAGMPVRRAIALTFLIALLREFAWQLPFEDAWKLKLPDRLLDSSEWALGAMMGTLLAAPAAQALAALLARLAYHPASPAAR